MKQRNIHLGPGAASLILIVVVLCMSVLGMLTMMSARSDDRYSTRAADVAQAVGALNVAAERSMAELDGILSACADGDAEGYLERVGAALPERMSLSGDTVSWLEEDGSRGVICAARILPQGSAPRAKLTRHRLWVDTQTEGFMSRLNAVLDRAAEAVVDPKYEGLIEQVRASLTTNGPADEKIVLEEAYRAMIPGNLPEDMSLEGDIISWIEESGDNRIRCVAEISPLGTFPRANLISHELVADDDDGTEEEWN